MPSLVPRGEPGGSASVSPCCRGSPFHSVACVFFLCTKKRVCPNEISTKIAIFESKNKSKKELAAVLIFSSVIS